jgi:hypothetical protein
MQIYLIENFKITVANKKFYLSKYWYQTGSYDKTPFGQLIRLFSFYQADD